MSRAVEKTSTDTVNHLAVTGYEITTIAVVNDCFPQSQCEMSQLHPRPQAFHVPQAHFTREAHFTDFEGIYFTKKALADASAQTADKLINGLYTGVDFLHVVLS